MSVAKLFEHSRSITSLGAPLPVLSNDIIKAPSLDEFFRAMNHRRYTFDVKTTKKADNRILSQGEAYNAGAFVQPGGEAKVERELRDSKSSFKVLVSRVSMHLGLEWLQKLFGQIDSLLDLEEWDKNDPVPAVETARTFIRMLLVLKVKRKPGLGVSNSGNLIAAWTSGANRLTVECLPNDRVRWVVSRLNEGEMERAVGDGRIERLRDLLQPYEPSVWFEYAE